MAISLTIVLGVGITYLCVFAMDQYLSLELLKKAIKDIQDSPYLKPKEKAYQLSQLRRHSLFM